MTLAVFPERHRWPVEWEISRQLLGAAFSGLVGDGDVVLSVDAGGLHIWLSSPDGEAELTGDSLVAWNFLSDTFEILAPCPVGWCGKCPECAAVGQALDAELETITREAMQ